MQKDTKGQKLRILFIADIFAKAGKKAVYDFLPQLEYRYNPDIIIANGENVAGGFGITPNLANKLFHYGIDVITLGNHAYDRKEIDTYLNNNPHIVRPDNYPPGNPGKGYIIHTLEDGRKLAVVNLMGRIYMNQLDCPFRAADRIIDEISKETNLIFIDFHAEATAEKRAFGRYVDGRVSAVCGTHTHIQTSDNHILPQGTAYITDAGMTGPHDSVIGVKTDLVLEHMLSGRKVFFTPSETDVRLQGAIIDIDDQTGKAISITRIDENTKEDIPLPERFIDDDSDEPSDGSE